MKLAGGGLIAAGAWQRRQPERSPREHGKDVITGALGAGLAFGAMQQAGPTDASPSSTKPRSAGAQSCPGLEQRCTATIIPVVNARHSHLRRSGAKDEHVWDRARLLAGHAQAQCTPTSAGEKPIEVWWFGEREVALLELLYPNQRGPKHRMSRLHSVSMWAVLSRTNSIVGRGPEAPHHPQGLRLLEQHLRARSLAGRPLARLRSLPPGRRRQRSRSRPEDRHREAFPRRPASTASRP